MRLSLSQGKRLRYFRTLRNMTQKQLGTAIGFFERTADVRIAQYESGARTPNEQTVLALAKALEVSSAALTVPSLEDETALMHLLFALEDSDFPKSSACDICAAISQWQRLAEKQKNGEITKEDYDEWRYSFSFSG